MKKIVADPRPRKGYDKGNDEVQTPDQIDEIDETDKNTQVLHEIKTKILKNGNIEFFRLVVDPESYSKTVINAFNLALAMRMKLVSSKMDGDLLNITLYDSSNSELDHSVLEITFEQYKSMRYKLYGR